MDKQKEKFSENVVSRAGDEDGLISLAEASKNSRYSQAYLSLRARKGKLKAVRHNNVWHTTQEWLREYEEKHGGNGNNGNGGESGHKKQKKHFGWSIPTGVFISLVAFVLFSALLFAAPPLASELTLPQPVKKAIEGVETWRKDTMDFALAVFDDLTPFPDNRPSEDVYENTILPVEKPKEDGDALDMLWAAMSGFEGRLSNLAKRITGRTVERELVTEVTEVLPIERIIERVEIIEEAREVERITEVIRSADLDLLMASIDSKYSTSGGVLTGNLTFPIGSAFTIGTPTGGAPSAIYVDDIIRVGTGTLTLTSSGVTFGAASIGLGTETSTKGPPGIIYDEEKGTWFLRGNDEYFSQITTRAIDRTGGGGGGSDSDWLFNGADIYSGAAGNVGIGLVDPSTLLQVDGLLTVGDSSSTNGALVFENTTNAFGVTVHAQNQTVGSATFAFPDTLGASDTICLFALGNCGGGAGNTLQQAYVAGNTILATNAEGDIDLTVAEATNFSVDITGTGSFLVQDGGVNVLQVADGGKTTFQPTTNQVDAFIVQDSIGTKLISVNTSTNQLILGDTSTSRYLTISTTGGNSSVAINATGNGGGGGSSNALFFVQQAGTSGSAITIKAAGTGLAGALINARTSDNQTIASIAGAGANLLAKAISGQAAPLFLTLDSSSNNLISIDSTGNLNLLKEGTATVGTQYSSQDLVLQGSVWDTTNVAAEDRQISLRLLAGSGADTAEPYRLGVLDNAGAEFVSFDGLNQRVGIGMSAPAVALDITTTDAAGINLYRNSANSSLSIQNDADYVYFGMNTSNNVAIGHNPDQTNAPFQIASGGNVGIGSDISPDAHLEVSANGTTGGNLFLLSSNDDNDGDILTVLESGLIGIGAAVPGALLDMNRASTSALLRITNTVSNGGGGIKIHYTDGTLIPGKYAFEITKGSGPTQTFWHDPAGGNTYIAGNLGVGISPDGASAKLIVGRDGEILQLRSSGAAGFLRIYDGTGGNSWSMGVGPSWPTKNFIIAENTNLSANQYFVILSGSGDVGIGTTGPDRKLDVLDASNPQLRLTQADGTVYTDFQMTSSGDLIMNVDGVTNQLVLDNGGNVGIGTTTPGSGLHIKQRGQSSSYGLRIENSGGSTSAINLYYGSSGKMYLDFFNNDTWYVGHSTLGTGNAGYLQAGRTLVLKTFDNSAGSIVFDMDGTEIARFNASGDLGIGTTTPQEKLTLGPSSNFATEMALPGAPTATPSVNGGSIATGTYYYVITASDGVGETLKGTESSATSVIGPTGSVALSWTAIQGASSYTVYRTTVSGTYSTPALIGTSTTASLTDTLLTPSAGAPPSSTNSYVNKFASSGDSWLLGGNVGIGKTANRNYTLNVQDSIRVGEKKAGLGYLTLKRSSIGSGTNDVDIEVRSDRDLYISELGNPNPFIHIDGDNDFTTFEAGLVGIGTTSPTALLNIKGNLSSALTGTVAVTNLSAAVVGTSTLFTTELAVGDSIKIGTETFTVSVITDAFNLTLDTAYQGSTASGLTAYRDPTLFVIDNGDSVNKLTVTSSGNVGIGTATPTELLTVGALGGATAFSVSDTGVLRGDYNGSLFIDSGYNSPYLRIGNSSLNRYVQIYYSIVDPVYGSPNALRFTASATGYPFSFEGGGFGIVNQSASREALIVRGATSQTADIFAAQNDTGLTLVSIDSNFNLNLLKEGTATVGTQYSSQDLVLQGSAWDSTLASAVDRQISFRTVAGSGATGLEPYRLDILDNAGTEFVSFDGLNQRVGIGTATPSYPLHVNGAIGVDGSIGEGVQFTTDGVTSADITLTTRGGSTFLYLRNAADSDYKDMAVGMLYARNSASVGGDSSPDAMLEVAKNGANDLLMLSSSVSGDGDFLIVDSSGNVGIATTSPTALLNIKGNLSSALTGTVAVTNLSAAVVGTSTLFTTELAVGDSIKIGTETFTVSVITDAFNLTLDTAYQGSTASGLTAYRDPTLLAIDNGDAVNKLIVTSSGNVGIGTATPDQSFTLSSTSMLGWDDGAGVSDVRIGRTGVNTIEITRPTVDPGQLTVEMFGNTTAATSIDSMLRLKASLGDNLEIYTRRASAPRIVSTGSDLQIYASNASYSILLGTDGSSNLNKVGIGNATPDAKLDVESTGAVTTTNYAQQINNLVTNVTTDAINKYGLYISSTGSFTGSAGTATNNYGLYVDTPTGGDNNYAAIFEGGNVGIGTVTPAVALQVVAANGEASIINSGSITAAGEILELKGTLGRTSTSSTYGSALYITNSITPSSGASNLSFVDIKGTINQTGFATGITRGIYVRPTLTSAIDFRAIDIASTGFGIYQSSSNATNYFNGNVGIATTSPITTLDVNGSTRLNGSATSVLTGSIDPIASITVTGVGTAFDAELVIGDRITVTGEARTVTAIASATSLTVDTAFSDNLNDTSPDRLAAQLTVLDSSSNLDFVINDQGNVGIGTATPHYQLEIGSNAGGQIDLRNLDSNSGGVQVGTVLGSLNFSGTDFAPDTDARTAAAIRGLGDRSWTGTASTHDAALAFFTQYDSSVGLVEQMRISSLGLVGIGTTPTETLTVADDFVGYAGSFFNDGNLDTRQGVFIQACLDVDPTTSCNFLELRDGDGTILGAIEGNGAGGVTNASAGGDYAELFPGNISDFEGGDLVALDSDGSVVLAMNTLPLLGAYSTNSNTLGNWRDGWKESGEWVPVGLLGQMMVNVTTENGDISVGDSITISSTAGVGMKAAQPGKVVGVALESFGLSQDSTSGEVVDGSYGIEVTGSIMVLVDPTWYIPNGAPSGGQLALSGVGLDGSQTDFIRGIKASIVDVFLTTGTYIRNGIVAFRELFVDKLFVNEFTVEGGDMRISDSDPTISSFVVEEGASEVTIENRNVRPQSQIYITFRGAPADIGGWSIVERVEGVSFTFAIAKPAPNDIDVDYWIVQTRKLDDSDSVIGEERSEEESPDVPRDVTDGLIGEFEPPLAEDMGVDLTSGVDENGLLSDTNSSSENNSGKGLIEGDSQSNSNGEGDGNDSLQDGSGSSVE